MDRRRLEHAHIRYAILNVAEWYQNFEVKNILFTPDQAETTLNEFTPLYTKAFYELYSSKQEFLHRAVCAVSEAGYVQYDG